MNNTQFHLYAGWVFLNYKVRLSSNLHARHRHFASLTRNQERNRIEAWVCIQRSAERGSAHLHLLHFISRLHVDHIHAWQRAQQKCVQRYRTTRAGCELLLHKRAAEELSSGCDGWEIKKKRKKEAAIPGSSTLVSAYPPPPSSARSSRLVRNF